MSATWVSAILLFHKKVHFCQSLFHNVVRHFACQWHKLAFLMAVTLMVIVAPKDYIAAMSWLPAEAITSTDSQTFGR